MSEPSHPYLSTRSIVLAAIALVLLGAGLVTVLLWAYGSGTESDKARLEAIKTAGTIVVGTGGAAALWLAARRQQTAEFAVHQKKLDQAHQDRVAAQTEHDASERRVTDLYTKSVELLGSENASVRLGGMYALERLAQNVPDQRQTIVNVLCAYLRMPEKESAEDRQVRLTAQRILASHLHPEGDTFWGGIDLDLTGAVLVDFDLTSCRVRTAAFDAAKFVGAAAFREVLFAGEATFEHAEFGAEASFTNAEFGGRAAFGDTEFADIAWFSRAVFRAVARFDNAVFGEDAWYSEAMFAGPVLFDDAEFGQRALFTQARFGYHAGFRRSRFKQDAHFRQAIFERGGNVSFELAEFSRTAWFVDAEFGAAARFDETVFGELAHFGSARFNAATLFTKARFDGECNFKEAAFAEMASFYEAEFGSNVSFHDAEFRGDVGLVKVRARIDVLPSSARVWPDGVSEVDLVTDAEAALKGREGRWGYLTVRA
ncbi:pentapeptide repeat-containing protein [Lentzea sp. NPDC058450]|uniref:pentapeptide repeat-containing protein n=1 Tax=Lentzea sp. NPDC058450 TaxID=3346505 RepID=UPI0036676C1F